MNRPTTPGPSSPPGAAENAAENAAEPWYQVLVERLMRLDLCELGRAQLAIVVYSVIVRSAMAVVTWRLGLPVLTAVSCASVAYYLSLLLLRGRPERMMRFILAYGVEWSLWALAHWFIAGPYSSFELYPLVLNSIFILLFRDLPTPTRLLLIALPPFTTALVIYVAIQLGPVNAVHLGAQLWLSLANEVVVTMTVMAVTGVALLEQVRGRREAERREVAQAQLVEDMSHEMQTPLATMLTLTQGALAPGRDERRMAERLEWIEESVREANRLVERLLDLAALDAREIHGPEADVVPTAPLVEVARGTTERARLVAEPRDIAVVFEVRAEIDRQVDAASLEAVLRNLLANAIAHSPDGSRIEVRVRREGRAPCIDVEDHGEGIAKEHLPRIFERMWRADPARSRSAGRYGLGLSIAQRHARLLGARLHVASEVGRGSTFSVIFDRRVRP